MPSLTVYFEWDDTRSWFCYAEDAYAITLQSEVLFFIRFLDYEHRNFRKPLTGSDTNIITSRINTIWSICLLLNDSGSFSQVNSRFYNLRKISKSSRIEGVR